MTQPVASILHQETVRRLSAGNGAFDRGKKYFDEGRVTGVERKEGAVFAKVRGTEATPYDVRIWIKDERLAYSCSCPQGQEQAFCKHAVAVALASIGSLAAVAVPLEPKPAVRAERNEPAPLAKTRAAVEASRGEPPKAEPAKTPPVREEEIDALPLADCLRAMSHEELVVVVLEAALEHDGFRARLVERLRRR